MRPIVHFTMRFYILHCVYNAFTIFFFLFFKRNEPGAVGTPRWMPPCRPVSNVVSGKVEKIRENKGHLVPGPFT